MGQHLQARCHAAYQAGDGRADDVGDQQAGWDAHFFLFHGGVGGRTAEHVGHARIQGRALHTAQRLYQQANVTVLPGRYLSRHAHGLNPGVNHVRMALVAPVADCVEAAKRIAQFSKTYAESL